MKWGEAALAASVATVLVSACGRDRPAAVSGAASALVTFSSFSPGHADPARKARLNALAPALDRYFSQQMTGNGATGLAVGLILEGELAYERGFGVRDLASQSPVDGNTVFRIASLTKSFTALSVMKLRDEGKLGLDVPAASYLPELSALVLPTRDSPPITARLLMTHASGLAYDDLWGAVTFGQSNAQLQQLLKSGVSFSSAPGSKFAYSNLGYALLGQIVSRVSGTNYRDYVNSNLLRPLGMNSTVWEAGEVPSSLLATGYHHENGQLVADLRPADGVFAAAGGLYTSVRDYARYAAWNLAAYPPRDDPEAGPVRRSTVREMHLGQREERGPGAVDAPIVRQVDDSIQLYASSDGFGWHSVSSCTEERVSHGGGEPGYFSYVLLLPKHQLGLVMLATSSPVGGGAYGGALKILRDGRVLAAAVPATPHPALMSAGAALETLLEHWDQALAQRTFDPYSLQYWWNANLRQDFAKLAREHGQCHSAGPLEADGPYQGTFRVNCERGAIAFELLESPAIPPRLQNAQWREEFPPSALQAKTAARLLAALGNWNADLANELFMPDLDLQKTRKSLALVAAEHGQCTVENGVFAVEHSPLSNDPGQAEFQLKCSDGLLDLSFVLEEKTAKVSRVSFSLPHGRGATCQ